jgi:poly(hydroxyalkanoate) depolymerase family esterase
MESRGSAAGLDYLLYLPDGSGRAGSTAARPAPLLVMLHGCTQDAAAFVEATPMLAHAAGVAVLYPEQSAAANPQRCWNWFDPVNQRRGGGEAAAIAALTRHLVAQHELDARRVYVAGISAGGMMAAILAATYPDIYAAVATHSAGAFPTAASVGDALAVMRGVGLDDATALAAGSAASDAMAHRVRTVPALIVHGTADAVVNVANAHQAAAAWWHVHVRATGTRMTAHTVRRVATENGREYVVEWWSESPGSAPVIEVWRVDALGHAWSGGTDGGSYADPAGPDAARIILDFLLRHSLP